MLKPKRVFVLIILAAALSVAATTAQGGTTPAAEPWAQLLSLGIGGIIAAIVLYWKRQDDKAYQNAQAEFANRLERITNQVLTEMNARAKTDAEIIAALRDLRFRLVEKLERDVEGK